MEKPARLPPIDQGELPGFAPAFRHGPATRERVDSTVKEREYIKRSKFLGTRKHRCGHNDYVSAMNIFWNSEASFPPGGKGGGFPDFMPPPGMLGSYMTVICLVATVPELGFRIHFTTKTIICCKALVGPQVPF